MGQSATLWSQAKDSLSAGQWDLAIGHLESLKSDEPSGEVFEHLAQAFAMRGRYLSVLSVYLEWAECELRRNDLVAAERALEYAHTLEPSSLLVHQARVRVTRAQGDTELLVKQLQDLAVLSLERGDEDSPIGWIRQAMEVAPENLELPVQLAEIFVSLGQISAAKKEYRHSIERYREAGKIEECLRPLRGLKLLHSDDAELLLEVGDTCLEVGRLDEAEEQYRAVLKLDLENRRALMGLGVVCRHKGLFRNGILALSKVLQLEPECAEAHRLLGEITAVSADPETAVGNYLRAAQLFFDQGKKEEAVDSLRLILHWDPENVETVLTLARFGLTVEEISVPDSLDVADKPSPHEAPRQIQEEASTTASTEIFEAERPVRPALIKKSEYSDSESSSEPQTKTIRPGLILRQDRVGSQSGLKWNFEKPPLPPRGEELDIDPEPEPLVAESENLNSNLTEQPDADSLLATHQDDEEDDKDSATPLILSLDNLFEPWDTTEPEELEFSWDEVWKEIDPIEEPPVSPQVELETPITVPPEGLNADSLPLPEVEEPEETFAPEPHLLSEAPEESADLSSELASLLVSTLPSEAENRDERSPETTSEALDASIQHNLDNLRRERQLSLDDEPLLERLGDLCLKFGLIQEALEHYLSLEAANPQAVEPILKVVKASLWLEDNERVIDGFWRVAEIYFRRGAFQQCQEALGSLLALEPEHKPAKQLMVDAFVATGQEKIAAWHLGQMTERWVMRGEFENAVKALEQLADLSPDQAVTERLAKLHDFQGNTEEAKRLYRSLRDRYEAESSLDKALEFSELIAATPGYDSDDTERLLHLYQRLGMHEKVFSEKRRLAERLRRQGDPRRAVELLQDVLSSNSRDLGTERLLVELYLEAGEYHLAEPHSDTLAEGFLLEKAYQEAICLFELWARMTPESAKIRERLAQFYQLSGDLEGAKLEWILATEAHQSQGNFERACLSLERALELAPDEREWRFTLTQIHLEKRADVESALVELRELFRQAPEWELSTSLYLALLGQERHLEELSLALTEVRRHPGGTKTAELSLSSLAGEVEHRPDDLDLTYALGKLYRTQGFLERAIELFQKLRRTRDFELRAYHELGLCFARKNGFNMRELALNQFQKGLALAGHDPESKYELYYDTACLLESMGRHHQAREHFVHCPQNYRDVQLRLTGLET